MRTSAVPTFDILEQDYLVISRLSRLQNSLRIVTMSGERSQWDMIAGAHVSCTAQWGRLKDHGGWIPVDLTQGGFQWWLHHSDMLLPLQCAIFPGGARFLGEESTPNGMSTLGNAATVVINRAFGYGPPSPSITCCRERFQLPVQSTEGDTLRPHIDRDPAIAFENAEESPMLIWGRFLLTVASSCLLHLDTVDKVKQVLQVVRDARDNPTRTQPLLGDAKRELFKLILDLIWCSIHESPLFMDGYLMDLEDKGVDKSLFLQLNCMLDRFAVASQAMTGNDGQSDG